MFSRITAGGLLTHIAGRTAIFAKPAAYVALFSTAPTADDGSGAVEVSGGGYARVATSAATWGAAAAPPPLIANTQAIVFPAATANWGTIVAAGLYDAASGGNLLFWDWLGLGPWRPCTLSAASPAVLTLPAHGLAAGAGAAFTPVFGGTAPALSGGSLAGLLTVAGPLTNDTLTLMSAGTPVAASGTGSGMLRPVAPQSVPAGVTLLFPAGALALLMGAGVPAPLQGRSAALAMAAGAPGSSSDPPLTADDGATDLTADDGTTILTAS